MTTCEHKNNKRLESVFVDMSVLICRECHQYFLYDDITHEKKYVKTLGIDEYLRLVYGI